MKDIIQQATLQQRLRSRSDHLQLKSTNQLNTHVLLFPSKFSCTCL